MSSSLSPLERLSSRVNNISIILIGVLVVLVSFFIRTDIFETILEIVGILGILAGLVITAAGIYWFGDEKGWWNMLREGDRAEPRGRLIGSPALFLLVLLLFTLPWMTIKCEGEDVVTVTAVEMITLEETIVSTPAGRDTLSPEVTDSALIYVAAVLAIAGIVLLFFPMHRDTKRYTRAVLGALGALSLLGFMAQMIWRIHSGTEGLASVSMEYGFYLSVMAFVAVIALQFVPMSVPPDEAPEVSSDE